MKHYIALKPMRVGDSVRQVGEEVPEAGEWPNLRTYLATGYIEIQWDAQDKEEASPEATTQTTEEVSTDDDTGQQHGPDDGRQQHVVLDTGELPGDGGFVVGVPHEQPIDFGQQSDEPDADSGAVSTDDGLVSGSDGRDGDERTARTGGREPRGKDSGAEQRPRRVVRKAAKRAG